MDDIPNWTVTLSKQWKCMGHGGKKKKKKQKTNSASCFQVIQSEKSSSRERLRIGKTTLPPSCLSLCRSHVRYNIFLISSLVSVPLLRSPPNDHAKKKKRLHRRQRSVFCCCVKFVFPLVAGSQLPKSSVLKAPFGASQCFSGSAAQWGISSRSVKTWGLSVVVGCRPALHDNTERKVYACCCDSPRRRSSQWSMPGWKSPSPVCTSFKQRGSGCRFTWYTV